MKRKLLAGLCVSMLTLSLVGCSSSDDKKEDAGSEKPPVEESKGFTGEKTVETKYEEGKADMVVTTIKFENGAPVDVKIDVKTEDGKMKKELSEAGDYKMANETAPWHEQMAALEKAIIENDFDLDKITLSDADGHTDAVSGVTIKVPGYLEGVKACLAAAKEGDEVDAVGTASLPANLVEFEKGIAADGRWIVTPVADITSDKDLVIDGEFYKKDDKANGVYRKIGLYAQDADKKVTAEYTVTAPKVVVKSENTNFVNGTIKGDLYVEAKGVVLKNTKVEGNVYFANEDAKASFVMEEEASVSGVQEVK